MGRGCGFLQQQYGDAYWSIATIARPMLEGNKGATKSTGNDLAYIARVGFIYWANSSTLWWMSRYSAIHIWLGGARVALTVCMLARVLATC